MATYRLADGISAETALRLCAVVVAVGLLVGAGVQTTGVAADSAAAAGGVAFDVLSDATDHGGVTLSLGISPKRALVSLAFLGAIAARNGRTHET